MTRRLVGFGLVGALALLVLPVATRAEGTSCNFPSVVTADGRFVDSTIPAMTNFYFSVNLTPGRSYSAEVTAPTAPFPAVPGTVTIYDSTGGCDGTATPSTNTNGIDPQVSLNGTRLSFTARTANNWIKIANATANAVPYRIALSETTMFGPAWSTIANYNTYYAFSNTTSVSITGTLTLTTTAGAAAGTTTITVPANGAAFTNTSPTGLNTPRMVTGNARLTHNGPPGAILIESDVGDFTLSPPYIQPVKFQAVREIR